MFPSSDVLCSMPDLHGTNMRIFFVYFVLPWLPVKASCKSTSRAEGRVNIHPLYSLHSLPVFFLLASPFFSTIELAFLNRQLPRFNAIFSVHLLEACRISCMAVDAYDRYPMIQPQPAKAHVPGLGVLFLLYDLPACLYDFGHPRAYQSGISL